MSDTKREKSNMELWAEEEIRIACERERHNGTPEGDCDYAVGRWTVLLGGVMVMYQKLPVSISPSQCHMCLTLITWFVRNS